MATTIAAQSSPTHLDYHFRICDPRPDDDYEETLDFMLKKISGKTICLDDHQMSRVDNMPVVLVRLKLSDEGRRQSFTFESAVERLCQKLVAKENRSRVETLTKRSIGGIVPLSPIFKAHWTISFFQEAVIHGPDHFEDFLADMQRDLIDHYMGPTMVILGFAVLAGIGSSFLFLQPSSSLPDPDAIKVLCTTAFSKVAEFFGAFIAKRSSTVSLKVQEENWSLAVKRFKNTYDELLDDMTSSQVAAPNQNRDTRAIALFEKGQVPYHRYARLCDLTEAAANVYTLREDLFEALVDARNEEIKKLAASGATSGVALWSLGGAVAMGMQIGETAAVVNTCATAAVAAACWPAAIVAGSIMVTTGTRAFFHYKEAKVLGKKKKYYENILNVTRVAWGVAFDMRLCMEWIRLTDGANPADLRFVDVASQRKWSQFITKYREATQASSNETPNAEYFLVWIDEQGQMLRNLRNRLDT
ncbi:hypothetical protein AOQ84DRAFT_377843 [Glonium stellatum]|uniref:Uncharacterized protein n=1 Tax=Glonium stellatum TaxID=574774 RepID=A0A8E2EYH8_9PEZI|nr:hypothetical protein AOQ84DRAFT_377843 [Glonium stellatum]